MITVSVAENAGVPVFAQVLHLFSQIADDRPISGDVAEWSKALPC